MDFLVIIFKLKMTVQLLLTCEFRLWSSYSLENYESPQWIETVIKISKYKVKSQI